MVAGILNSAVSGLSLNAQRIAAAADNIANTSTRGYKRTDVQASTLATRQSTTAYAAGGVQAVSRPLNGVQGLLASSGSSTDLALSGAGYFAVTGPSGGQTLFTRNGSFAPNANGDLVNSDGFALLAESASASSSGDGGLSKVNINSISGTADASTKVSIDANLPAQASVGQTFTITAQTTDSLGGGVDIALNFTAQAGGTYDVTVGAITESATGATTAIAREGDSSGPAYDVNVSFGGNGLVSSFDGNPTPARLSISNLSSGAADLSLELDLGGLTRFGSDFALGGVSADGAGYGQVSAVDVSTGGRITARFDNGEQRLIADIQVATFTDPSGLSMQAGGVYAATDASGAPIYQTPGQGGAGSVQSGALELSTTDLATEITNLMIAETSYRASLQVVKAADQLSQSLLDEIA
ncbi:flagellar hook-basal body complex protein [Magnetovibrio blakemorei]|uniref:Flagellar hook protein FlgE n=1 Tax=Magnetovibrio blakemorei TaxID=28181 RepID=A0A1E5QAQ0_9PROT|nr:flagellar hook-basal body complex protein [Magnetovibrio blakemorei]OEJ69053.1 hypothetical protein BEN30_04920 [Magnetovibrio blakemorei]